MASTPYLGLNVYTDAELVSAFSTTRDWRKGMDGNNGDAEDPSNMQMIDNAFAAMNNKVNGKQDKLKIFTNVSASSWVSDSTYANYPYRCDINCVGITADSIVEVIFAMDEATSGNYAPICASSLNTVTIYSKVNTAIVIPTIKEV